MAAPEGQPSISRGTLTPQEPAAMEKLPGDLVSNILIRLPAKLLAQMRCVSKPWNAFLSQPSFIKSHLHRSIHTNDEIVLVFEKELLFDFKCMPFTAHRSQSPHLQLPDHFIKLPPEDLLPPYWFTNLVGSVNGLVCLSSHQFIYIWNPSLSAFITLPSYTMPYCYDSGIKIFLRFGFDPKTDDYKVVKITGRTPNYFGPVEEWLQVEVYSMRNQSWGLITERVPSHVKRFIERDQVCVDGHHGHLHWLASFDEVEKVKTIAAFDLGIETFSLISLPDILIDYTKRCWNVLGVLGEKLCVMSCDSNYDCEVWVMDEYGVTASWVKNHTFSQFSNILPFGFTLNNEFLFETYEYRLALYDPVSETVKLFKSMPEYRDRYTVVVYVDSLVWVAPAGLIEYKGKSSEEGNTGWKATI